MEIHCFTPPAIAQLAAAATISGSAPDRLFRRCCRGTVLSIKALQQKAPDSGYDGRVHQRFKGRLALAISSGVRLG